MALPHGLHGPHGRHAVSVSDVLRRALPEEARRKIYGIALVEKRWAEAVGEELARRSVPDSLNDGVLTVRVADAVWGHMILKHAPRVIAQLNRALGARLVRRVNFKTVSDLRVELPEKPPAEKPLSAPVPAIIAEAARTIEDVELRTLVSRAAARYLAIQKERERKDEKRNA